jgi:hypothetical protein
MSFITITLKKQFILQQYTIFCDKSTYFVKINKEKYDIKNNIMCFYTLIFNIFLSLDENTEYYFNSISFKFCSSDVPTRHFIPASNG